MLPFFLSLKNAQKFFKQKYQMGDVKECDCGSHTLTYGLTVHISIMYVCAIYAAF